MLGVFTGPHTSCELLCSFVVWGLLQDCQLQDRNFMDICERVLERDSVGQNPIESSFLQGQELPQTGDRGLQTPPGG